MATRKAKPELDLLDEIDAERTARNPEFPKLAAAAEARRKLGRLLAKKRRAKKLSQQKVARDMETTQATVSRLESGADVMLSTLLRYARTLGVELKITG